MFLRLLTVHSVKVSDIRELYCLKLYILWKLHTLFRYPGYPGYPGCLGCLAQVRLKLIVALLPVALYHFGNRTAAGSRWSLAGSTPTRTSNFLEIIHRDRSRDIGALSQTPAASTN